MADTVSFKVYLTKEEDPIDAKPEVRRFGIDKDVVSNYLYLTEKLQAVFTSLRSRRFTISWKDADGDNVIISSDEELKIALSETNWKDVRQLYVLLHSEYTNAPNDEKELPQTLHVGITCDGCDKDVYGFRYKCIQCPDYDLCADCEAKGLHPEHCMIRSAVPLQWRPHFGRRLAHHMNKFARKSGHSPCEKEKETSECPYKKGKFGHPGGHGHGHGHGHAHARHGGSYDRPSWLDSLATYLNDWAPGIPANGDCPVRDPSGPEQTGDSARNESSNSKGAPGPTVDTHAEFFKNIGENLANLLDPLGIDVQYKHDTCSAPAAKQTENGAKSQSSCAPLSTPAQKFPGEGQKLNDGPAAPIAPQNTPISTAAPSMDKPSLENEGWTLLNQQDTATLAVAASDGTSNGAIPKQPATSFVPPTSTAVTVPASAPPTNLIYPQLPTQPEVIPVGESPVIYHPNPNIQRAVVAMMQMGFSNDGGWLTQLLASKNGDISKTLDILQPVRPTTDKQ